MSGLQPGFGDPVVDAQRTFRHVLDGFAYAASPRQVPVPVEPPAPLNGATAALLLTLVDYETPVWLDPAADTADVREWLRFHCAAPLVDRSVRAAFAIVADPSRMPGLAEFDAGEDEYPDRSATLLVQLPELTAGEEGWRARGPGIREEARIEACALPAHFLGDWAANGALFPRGVDLVLTCGDRFLALPRTTRLED